MIGVHTPEFAFEKDAGNVRRAVAELKIGYPVAIDSNYAIWRSFSNQYWPAHYFIDARGQIRHHHFGEGEYDESERVIQQLLAEAGVARVATGLVSVNASGVEAAADEGNVGSPETYVGYSRTENFVSPGGAVENAPHAYVSGSPRLNEWGLSGDWTVAAENAVLDQAGGGIVYRFHARDLHLVLGAAADGKPVRFRVTIDGVAPGSNHGADVALRWLGHRYQLSPLPAHSANWRHRGPDIRDPVPRSRRSRICVHLRLIWRPKRTAERAPAAEQHEDRWDVLPK